MHTCLACPSSHLLHLNPFAGKILGNLLWGMFLCSSCCIFWLHWSHYATKVAKCSLTKKSKVAGLSRGLGALSRGQVNVCKYAMQVQGSVLTNWWFTTWVEVWDPTVETWLMNSRRLGRFESSGWRLRPSTMTLKQAGDVRSSRGRKGPKGSFLVLSVWVQMSVSSVNIKN